MPNDPYYDPESLGTQWNLNIIEAAKAWDITKGDADIEVAIIEAHGINRTHEDLTNKFDPAKGDFTYDPSSVLNFEHGANVAGVVGAETNNDKGIASLGWNIEMIPYHWTGWLLAGYPYEGNLAQKITEAVEDDTVEIINLSLETLGICNLDDSCDVAWDYPAVKNAVLNALIQGVIVVAAAGNDDLTQLYHSKWTKLLFNLVLCAFL